jgi:hypothetical protein
MRTSRITIGLLPALLGAQFMIAGPARAVEDERITTVHGTACRLSKNPRVAVKFPRMITAGIGNTDPNTQTVDCPIPLTSASRSTFLSAKHNMVSNGTFGDKCNHFDSNSRPWVEVYDRNPTADVSCTLFILIGGNAVQTSFTVASTGINQGPAVKLFFPMTNFMAMTDPSHVYVQCQIPPPAADVSYVARLGFPTCEGDPP